MHTKPDLAINCSHFVNQKTKHIANSIIFNFRNISSQKPKIKQKFPMFTKNCAFSGYKYCSMLKIGSLQEKTEPQNTKCWTFSNLYETKDQYCEFLLI